MIDKMMTVGWQGAHLTCHQTTTWDEAEVPGALRRRTLTRLLHTVFSISNPYLVLLLGGVKDPHTIVTYSL